VGESKGLEARIDSRWGEGKGISRILNPNEPEVLTHDPKIKKKGCVTVMGTIERHNGLAITGVILEMADAAISDALSHGG